MIEGKAPISYADWHEIFHWTRQHCLAPAAMSYLRWRVGGHELKGEFFAEQREKCLRSLVQVYYRLRRIETHLDEAAERNDVTYRAHSAWVESLLGELGKDGDSTSK